MTTTTTTRQETGLPVGTWQIDPVHSSLEFQVRNMGLVTVKGFFADFEGSLEVGDDGSAQAEGTVQVASVHTRSEKRDEHLRSADFFNVTEFPAMSYKGKATKFNGDAPATVEGELTLLGVTKPVTLTVERWKCGPDPRTQGKRYFCGGNTTGAFNRSDFGMKFIVGPVSDEVKLWMSLEAFRD